MPGSDQLRRQAPDQRAAPTGTPVVSAANGGPTVQRILLGAQLRRLREASGVSREDAAETIRASPSKISRLELGRVPIRDRDIVDLLHRYRVVETDLVQSLLRQARQARQSGWWRSDRGFLPSGTGTVLGMEPAAQVIRSYEPRFVPYLFQTADYARAVVRFTYPNQNAVAVERGITILRRHQQLLTRPDPPDVCLVIEEAAIDRRFVDESVWHAQLTHLVDATAHPRITIRIIESSAAGLALAYGPFTALGFAESDLPDVVYLQQRTGIEFLDKGVDVETYLGTMDRLVEAALTPADSIEWLRARSAR